MTNATLVYDDDCGFCTWWADFFAANSTVRIVGFSRLTPDLEDRLPVDYERCAHFVTADAVYSCGEAVEVALRRAALVPEWIPWTGLDQFGPYVRLRERGYRWIADNRGRLGKIVSKRPPARRTNR
ncbi:MAG: thiol-disulfide oxidoreductase DCC family protein [Halobacteriota archaeon]